MIRSVAILPSVNESTTIGDVTEAVDLAASASLRLIVNVDSSDDGATRLAFEGATATSQKRYISSHRGKGLQVFRGFEAVEDNEFVLLADTDVLNPDPLLYRSLLAATVGGADLAIAGYRRSWYEANLTNHVARPLVAVAGADIPQPIAGDLSLSPRGVRAARLARFGFPSALASHVDGYGVDAVLLGAVLAAGGVVVSVAASQPKVHAPSFPHMKRIFFDESPLLLDLAAHALAGDGSIARVTPYDVEESRLEADAFARMRSSLDLMATSAPYPGTVAFAGDRGDSRWSHALSAGLRDVVRGASVIHATSELWPAYLERVGSYLDVGVRAGPRAAQLSLDATLSTFLGSVSRWSGRKSGGV